MAIRRNLNGNSLIKKYRAPVKAMRVGKAPDSGFRPWPPLVIWGPEIVGEYHSADAGRKEADRAGIPDSPISTGEGLIVILPYSIRNYRPDYLPKTFKKLITSPITLDNGKT